MENNIASSIAVFAYQLVKIEESVLHFNAVIMIIALMIIDKIN